MAGRQAIGCVFSSLASLQHRHILVSRTRKVPLTLRGVVRHVITVRSNTAEAAYTHVSIRARLTFGRPCLRPTRRPPASNFGRRSCLPAAPPSGCCRFGGCSPGSQTLKNDVGAGASRGSVGASLAALVLLKILR